MRPSDDLFRLVKTMTGSEKRYFKIFASMHGRNKKYLLLFDAIDRQERYDERALKEEFRDQKFIRQLGVAKGYLYNLVLKSLRLYRNSSGVGERLRTMQSNIEVLHERGLADQALKIVDRAKRIAEHHEAFGTMISLLDWERALRPQFKESLEEIERSENLTKRAIEQMQNFVEYSFLLYKVSHVILPDHLRSSDSLESMESLMQNPLLTGPEQARTRRAEFYFHWVYSVYHYGQNEFVRALHHTRAMVSLLEEDEDRLGEQMELYVLSLGNSLTLLRQADMYDEFWETVAKIRELIDRTGSAPGLKSRRISAHLFSTVFLYLSALYISQASYDKCIELAKETEPGLENYGELVAPSFLNKFNYNVAFAYFALGKYREAVEYTNRILLEPEPYEGSQTCYSARLLRLVLHYELGNIQLLESLVVSTYRYLISRESIYELEKTVIEFFRKLPAMKSNAELTTAFMRLRDRMLELESDPFEQNAFRYFAYVEWLESKILNRPFQEVYRERRARLSEEQHVAAQ